MQKFVPFHPPKNPTFSLKVHGAGEHRRRSWSSHVANGPGKDFRRTKDWRLGNGGGGDERVTLWGAKGLSPNGRLKGGSCDYLKLVLFRWAKIADSAAILGHLHQFPPFFCGGMSFLTGKSSRYFEPNTKMSSVQDLWHLYFFRSWGPKDPQKMGHFLFLYNWGSTTYHSTKQPSSTSHCSSVQWLRNFDFVMHGWREIAVNPWPFLMYPSIKMINAPPSVEGL